MDNFIITELPKNKRGTDYQKLVGNKILVCYSNDEYSIYIHHYDNKKGLIYIYDYKGDIQHINISGFRKCSFGTILGVINKYYIYKNNQIIENKFGKVKVINRYRGENGERRYKCECMVDGYINDLSEYEIKKNQLCSVCTNHKVLFGYNDLYTTNPEYIEYFRNIYDAKSSTVSSAKKVELVCPICGEIKEMRIYTLTDRGFSCSKCGDGFPLSEKLMFNLLSQLDLEFETEYSPEWIKPKRYDFYIPSLNLIIEMDGAWHKKDNSMSGQTKEESKQLDNFKDSKAHENGIILKRIDCYECSFEYIKNNVLLELDDIFDFSNINWHTCKIFSYGNILKSVCDIWNDKHDVKLIESKLKLSNTTVVRYLNIGKGLDICDYENSLIYNKRLNLEKACDLWNSGYKNKKDIADIIGVIPDTISLYLEEGNSLGKCDYTIEKAKIERENNISRIKILCITTKEVFSSLKEAELKYPMSHNINSCCYGRTSYSGIYKGEKLQWCFPSDFDENFNYKSLLKNDNSAKYIYCKNDGLYFENLTKVSNHYLIPAKTLSRYCLKTRNNKKYLDCNGNALLFEYVDYNDIIKHSERLNE